MAYPRDARIYYAGSAFLGYCISILILPWIAIYFWMSESSSAGNYVLAGFLSIFVVFLMLCTFGAFKAWKEAHKMSDIEALWSMQNQSIVRFGMDTAYANEWSSLFPELAERINPRTGNINPYSDPIDKPWREVQKDIKEMIHAVGQKKLNHSKPKDLRGH